MFYRAVVKNNTDPEKLGRCQVLVYGIHSEDIDFNSLPWAEVSGGTDFGLYGGVGITSILRKGTLVWVFFHNNDYNYPVVFAVIKGGGDINDIASKKYSDIATLKTASGHIIELGDVGGAEKIEIKHMSGTKIVLEPDGSILIESVNNMTHKVANNYEIIAGGGYKVSAARIDLN